MAISAPLAATLFENPQLKPIVMALSLVVLIQSFGAISGAALQQKQRFKVMAGIEIVTTGLAYFPHISPRISSNFPSLGERSGVSGAGDPRDGAAFA